MVALHLLLPVYRYRALPYALVGFGLLVFGVLLNLSADREFKARQTTVKPYETSSALITSFPFSISRHPMYLGMVMVLAGVAMLIGTVSCLVPVVVFTCVIAGVFIPVEEKMLANTFGDEWQRYRSRVRRWL
jgi:protein-S-isoprenylcysteine O-methyltransferase Ste14